MKALETLVNLLNNWLYSYVLIALLIVLGLYFTFKIRFGQFTLIGNMFRLMAESAEVTDGKKGISPFQAFSISAASRIGTGNIAGVAIAIDRKSVV